MRSELTPAAPSIGQPFRSVQLLHTLPDGSKHIDWLIAQDARGVLPLATFRLERRLDDLADGETLMLQRLANHRSIYLDFEGNMSAGRGHVQRLWTAEVTEWSASFDLAVRAGLWRIGLRWTEGGQAFSARIELKKVQDPQWLLFFRRVER